MFVYLIWWGGVALGALLLVRAFKERLLGKFPLFYTYIAWTLLVDLVRFYLYRARPGSYAEFYWGSELVSILAAYGVILEIYKRALENYPGVARRAQNLLLLVLFVAAAKVVVNTLSSPSRSWVLAIAELGRDLRNVQGALLIVLLGLFGHYRIPAGRNLRGLICGYGFFIATSISSLAFRARLRNELSLLMQKLQPVLYLIALLIWCVALWSYQPEPQPDPELDYLRLVRQTRALLARSLTHVWRVMR
jgi:hypothetical protein